MGTKLIAGFALIAGSAFAAGDPTLDFSQARIEGAPVSLEDSARQLAVPPPLWCEKAGAGFGRKDQTAKPRALSPGMDNCVVIPKGDPDPKMLIPVTGSCDPKILKVVPSTGSAP